MKRQQAGESISEKEREMLAELALYEI